jgi:hypothetical protein
MLFPTIERMAATPQGRVMTPVLCRLRYVAYLPIFLLSLLPDVLKTFMVKLVFRGLRSLDHSTVPPTVSLINVDTAGESLPLFNSVSFHFRAKEEGETSKLKLCQTTVINLSM